MPTQPTPPTTSTPTPPDIRVWLAVHDAAARHGLDPALVHAIAQAESNYDPTAVSPKGAVGVMQLMPETAKALGVDPYNVHDNIEGGARYLAQLSKQFDGDVDRTLAAYNAGPAAVTAARGVPDIPETRAYVDRVKSELQRARGGNDNLPDFGEWMKARQQASATPFTDAYHALRTQDASGPADASPSAKSFTDAVDEFRAGSSAPLPDAARVEPPSLAGFGSNVITSGARFAGNLASTLLHPIDTATNLGKLAAGSAELVLPDAVKSLIGDYTPQAKAVGRFYAQRYSSPQQILDTLYRDPVGAAADASALLGGVSGLARGVGAAAGAAGAVDAANTASRVGNVARVAGEVVNPLALPIAAVEGVGSSAARGIMRAALRPSAAVRADYGGANALASTALDNGISVSTRGTAKAAQLADDAIAARNAIISRAAAAGQTARAPQIVANVLPDLLAHVSDDVTPEAKIAAVNDVADEFLRKFQTAQGPAGPSSFAIYRQPDVAELEKLKERTYEYTPSSAWTSNAVSPAARDARVALAGEVKRTIENLTNGYENGGASVKDLNARYAALKGVETAIRNRLDANPSLGLGTLGEIGLGVLGPHGSVPIAVGLHLARQPLVESLAARGLGWLVDPAQLPLNLQRLPGAAPVYSTVAPNRLLTQKAALLRAMASD